MDIIRVSKSRLGGRPGFVALWRDAKSGQKFCRGISTTDEIHADEIIAAIQRILNTKHLLDPEHPDHLTTMAEAYRAVFRKAPPEPSDFALVEVEAGPPRPIMAFTSDGEVMPVSEPRRRIVTRPARVPAMKTERRDTADWKVRALAAEQKNETLQAENLRQSKALNKHCVVTLGKGVEDFKKQKTDVSKRSLDTYVAALKDLQTYLGSVKLNVSYENIQKKPKSEAAKRAHEVGGMLKIAELRGKQIDDFLSARIDKKTLASVTEKRKAALKRELSVAYHFWVRRYELTHNAFEHTQLLTGHKATAPDSREMIRTVGDLKLLLWALGEESEHALYWKTFVATAALTGADLSTLFDLKPQDVLFEEPARFIMCRNKTGKQRDTPIERTILLPLITSYSQGIEQSQPFLFPSVRRATTRKISSKLAGGSIAASWTCPKSASSATPEPNAPATPRR